MAKKIFNYNYNYINIIYYDILSGKYWNLKFKKLFTIMYLSKLFVPITKDVPSEAKIKSHQLMIRTGMIKQSSAGIYSWLPLGFKVMKKLSKLLERNKI